MNDFKQYSKKSYEQIDGSSLHGRIRKRRIDKQIYVGDMHKLLGVSYSQYIKIENGEYQLHHMDKLIRLCEILDIAPEEIYTPYQIFIMNNQGKQIKAYRKANGLTQTELAERLFVHRKTVSRKSLGIVLKNPLRIRNHLIVIKLTVDASLSGNEVLNAYNSESSRNHTRGTYRRRGRTWCKGRQRIAYHKAVR